MWVITGGRLHIMRNTWSDETDRLRGQQRPLLAKRKQVNLRQVMIVPGFINGDLKAFFLFFNICQFRKLVFPLVVVLLYFPILFYLSLPV